MTSVLRWRGSFPQSMEKLGQNYGYILYHSTLDTEEKLEKLRLWEANDRANILWIKNRSQHFTIWNF